MQHYQGLESIFYIKYDGLWCPISCEISSPLSETIEMLNTTTRDNAGWKTERPTGQSYSLSIDAIETKDNYNDIVSYRKIRKFKRDRIKIEWKRETIQNYLIDSGFGYITEISDANTVGEEISFNFTISGFGKPIENEIPDIYSIYSDAITYNFTYEHEPEDETDSGQWYLVNRLYNNYYNAFGIVYDCDLTTIIKAVPPTGFLANNTTRQIYEADDIISYCDKDELVYFPNGFNNDLGVTGDFVATFDYRIIDANGKVGKLTTHTINMTDSLAPEIDISVSILWGDDTSAPKSGNLGSISVKLASLVFDPLDPIVTQTWEIFDGTDWVFYKNKTSDNETFDLTLMENKIRLKVISQFGEEATSNNLIYEKVSTANIYITDRTPNSDTGIITYKLHVENESFIGYCNMEGNKINTRNSRIQDTYGNVLYIPNIAGIGDNTYTSQPVNIPVGVYDCHITIMGIRLSSTEDGIINAGVSYGFGSDYNAHASVESSVIGELIIPQD